MSIQPLPREIIIFGANSKNGYTSHGMWVKGGKSDMVKETDGRLDCQVQGKFLEEDGNALQNS